MAYIYLMESIRDYDTVYKIGFSKSPNDRLPNIQTGNDGNVKIVSIFYSKHGRRVETALHNFYSHCKKNMEWFALDLKEVYDFIPLCEKIESNFDHLENFKDIPNPNIELIINSKWTNKKEY
jgi:hypothetical protein